MYYEGARLLLLLGIALLRCVDAVLGPSVDSAYERVVGMGRCVRLACVCVSSPVVYALPMLNMQKHSLSAEQTSGVGGQFQSCRVRSVAPILFAST